MRFMVYSRFVHVSNLKLGSRWEDKPNIVHIMRPYFNKIYGRDFILLVKKWRNTVGMVV